MDEQYKELNSRLREVEGYIKMVFGGVTVLAACCVAFLGIEYVRIPHAVDSAVNAQIDAKTMDRIKEANKAAKALLKSEAEQTSWDGKKGYCVVGEAIVQWGTVEVDAGKFEPFTYPKAFQDVPALCCTGDGTAEHSIACSTQNLSKTGAEIWQSGTKRLTVRWIAVGQAKREETEK